MRRQPEAEGHPRRMHAAWAALREQLSERETVDFLMLVGQYDMLATTLSVLRLKPDAPR